MLTTYRRRLLAGLRTLPSPRGWLFCLAVSVVTLAVMFVFGLSTGLYHLTSTQPGLAYRMVLVFFAPALGEEIVFRGLLVPHREEGVTSPWPIRLSILLYVLWHVLEALTFLPHAAPVFLRLDFLACCGFLGVGCTVMRVATGSIWPAVILHWALVVVWQTWLGGVSALS